MIDLEYDGVKIGVPESWRDVTLGRYEKIYKLKPTSNAEAVQIIAGLCDVDAALLRSWPAEVFDVMVSSVMFIYDDAGVAPSPEIKIDGKAYRVPIEDQITLGAWIDTDEVQKGEEGVLSGVFAINCRPVGEAYDYKNNEARQKMFADAPMSDVLPVMGFFLQCKTALNKLTRTYGGILELADLLPRNTELLRSLGAGTKLSRIWQVMRFCILNASLRYRLRKFSRSYNSKKIKSLPRMRSAD